MSASGQVTIEPANSESPVKLKRQRHSIAEKRRVVEESFHPGTSVARVAREHGINANQVFKWRGLYQRGKLGSKARVEQPPELLAVTVADARAVEAAVPIPPVAASQPTPAGTIQVHLARGRLRIEGVVDPGALRVVLECLLG